MSNTEMPGTDRTTTNHGGSGGPRPDRRVVVGSVRFLSDWSHEQNGDIRPGEPLVIEYAIDRLPRCRASRYGQDAWNIAASMRFHPNGQEHNDAVKSGSLKMDVPIDATKIELWFHNTDHTGCSTWDSRYGQNYWLDVTPG